MRISENGRAGAPFGCSKSRVRAGPGVPVQPGSSVSPSRMMAPGAWGTCSTWPGSPHEALAAGGLALAAGRARAASRWRAEIPAARAMTAATARAIVGRLRRGAPIGFHGEVERAVRLPGSVVDHVDRDRAVGLLAQHSEAVVDATAERRAAVADDDLAGSRVLVGVR